MSGAYKINDSKEYFITDAKLSGHPSLSPEIFNECGRKWVCILKAARSWKFKTVFQGKAKPDTFDYFSYYNC